MGSSLALNLCVIYTHDLAKALNFYQCLGLSFQLEQHGRGSKHYASQLGSLVFELYPRPKASLPIASTPSQAPLTIRLGFTVDSIPQILSQLQAQGHIQVLPTATHQSTVVQDPDGNKIELRESTSTPNGDRLSLSHNP